MPHPRRGPTRVRRGTATPRPSPKKVKRTRRGGVISQRLRDLKEADRRTRRKR